MNIPLSATSEIFIILFPTSTKPLYLIDTTLRVELLFTEINLKLNKVERAYNTFATLNRNIVVIQKIIAKQTHTIQLKIQTNTANVQQKRWPNIS